jgi:hypothetical protein
MVAERTLYEEVTKIAEDYLGPAAPRFVDRLISNHLHKSPEDLKRGDIKALTTWTRLAVSVITNEEETVEDFVQRLQVLSRQ